MSVTHFQCTGCGKCCTGAPEVTVTEAVGLADTFVFSGAIRLVPNIREMSSGDAAYAMGTTGLPADDLFDNFDLISAERGSALIGDKEYAVVVSMQAIGLNSVRACPALTEGGLCSVYVRRPAMCRSIPMEFLFADRAQPKLIDRFLNDGKARGFECEYGETAPVVVRDGKIVDDQYAQAVRDGRDASNNFSGALFLAKCMRGSLISQEMMREALRGVSIPIHPSWIMYELKSLSDKGLGANFTLSDIATFQESQLRLIEGMLTVAKAKKRKEDRPITNMLRAMKAYYPS